ncbi:MAG: hypothetical protein AAGJ18_20315 [Bacteroidota bacterium]
MSFRLSLGVLVLALCLFSCQEENIDELTQEVLPQEPIEVETQNRLLTYRLQETEVNYENGYGVVLRGPLSGSTLYAIGSDTFNCVSTVEANSVGLSIQGSFTDFFVSFYQFENGNAFATTAILSTVVEGDTITAYGADFIDPSCRGDVEFLVNIEEETDEFIRGTFETEFFQLIVDSTETTINCENWKSLGILNAEFAVPLGSCN